MTISRNSVLLVVTGGLFVCLAALVMLGYTSTIDENGVMALRGGSPTVIEGDFWQTLVAALTHLGDSIVLGVLTVIAVAVLIQRNQKHAAKWFLITAAGSFIITAVAKWAFGRDRPEIVEQIVSASSAAFPSGHTLRSAVVYSLLAYLLIKVSSQKLNKLIITIAFTIILINGISRVYLGVHWPTDIVGAWLIAGFWLTLCKFGYDRRS